MIEKTLVLIKPDAFNRGLTGEIITRFERIGLAIEEMKLLKPSRKTVAQHYPDDRKWLISIGNKTLDTYQKYHLDVINDFGNNHALDIGEQIRNWLIDYITSGTVIAMLIRGNHAIEVARKMVGNTAPFFAELGTIRGDYSIDSPDLADREKRAIQNLVHASGSLKEAEREIDLWFPQNK